MSKVSMWDTRAVMQDAGVQAHSQKFGFVQNLGKSIENIFKTPENQEKNFGHGCLTSKNDKQCLQNITRRSFCAVTPNKVIRSLSWRKFLGINWPKIWSDKCVKFWKKCITPSQIRVLLHMCTRDSPLIISDTSCILLTCHIEFFRSFNLRAQKWTHGQQESKCRTTKPYSPWRWSVDDAIQSSELGSRPGHHLSGTSCIKIWGYTKKICIWSRSKFEYKQG